MDIFHTFAFLEPAKPNRKKVRFFEKITYYIIFSTFDDEDYLRTRAILVLERFKTYVKRLCWYVNSSVRIGSIFSRTWWSPLLMVPTCSPLLFSYWSPGPPYIMGMVMISFLYWWYSGYVGDILTSNIITMYYCSVFHNI